VSPELNPGQRRTNLVVGAVLGLLLLGVTFYLAGVKVGAFLSALLLYEGFTLVDRYQANTISESIWRAASRPLLPLVFGLGFGWAVTSGTLQEPWLILAFGILLGHFFWQVQSVYAGKKVE
jgi:hypothetical protein